MTALLQHAFETLRDLPDDMQDDLARMLLQLSGIDQPAIALDAAEAASLDLSLQEADRGEFATDAQIRAIWAKHGL